MDNTSIGPCMSCGGERGLDPREGCLHTSNHPHFTRRMKEEAARAGARETWAGDQLITNIHDPVLCEGRGCWVHHPSEHHMVEWPIHWRADVKLAERICPHGIGHPDPDDMEYQKSLSISWAGAAAVHACDGCCRGVAAEC